jgi:predicted transposase YdaD
VSKPFDASLKELIEVRPADWNSYLGLSPARRVRVIEADVSTVTAQADKVLLVGGAHPFLLHLELQTGYDDDLADRVLMYNVLLRRRHSLPVQSVIVLLRRSADGPQMSGLVQHALGDQGHYLRFLYKVVRAWQKPVDSILKGGLGTLPLAPLCDESEAMLPEIIRRMELRISREANPRQAATLWSACYVLMGLRYPPALSNELFRGVRAMKESSTYQAILAEGARNMLLLQGGKRFGPPDPDTVKTLEAIFDVDRLLQLGERLLDVKDWKELLAKPRPRRHAAGSSNP